jgi:valyl-tRNA synthetase
MDKRFDPSSYEQKWQRFWAERELFVCASGAAAKGRESFCILIPPPNVTGKLHIGHALQSTLQDLLTRWRRMQGYNALWLPGTDHAGIATQLMVERQLEREGTSRRALGRERFVERVWKWKEQYHCNIRRQLGLLGASCDWTRERFTLDEGLSRAVREAFVRLYEEGLIRRGEYMVNWSPVLQTAISDLEVETRTVEGKLYHLAYPLEGTDERLVVATTRPETMLGDTAVARNPDDERYRGLEGRHAILPLVGRRIPVISDPRVDPEFGTGLVKVTPLHDPNDFEMAQRHGLPGVQVIGFDGTMTEDAGADFAGLDRFAAREKVVERLEADGLLVKVEKHVHNVGHSQRSGEPVEPMVSTQWFADVSAMAQGALEAVKSGELALVPASWEKTWEHWLSNIRPWVLSRQLWWGHRIPAWYDEKGEIYVARTREEAEAMAGTDRLEQDPDVLDTWFSSGLWPLSTLGWPERTDDLETFYPTDVLITAFDILFFWVARMVMMGLHFSGELPFRTVHLTGLVRDASGEKMSKTKGNTLDPEDLVREYGADALRFTLAALDSPGRDIPLDPERMAGYRAFGNKIWNATRFALGRIGDDARVQAELEVEGLAAPERWILSRLSRTAAEVNERFECFRFDEACHRLYHFFWGELCDWYIELSKPALFGDAPRPRVGEVLLTVLERSLRLLHPVMPHLTEELWQRLPGHEVGHPESVALAAYPERREEWEDEALEEGVDVLQQVVTRVRAERTSRGLTGAGGMTLHLEGGDEDALRFLGEQEALIRFLCRIEGLRFDGAAEGAVRDLIAGVELAIVVATADESTERERLLGELAKLEAEIGRAKARLANRQFVERAPAEVVEGNRRRLVEMEDRRARMVETLG